MRSFLTFLIAFFFFFYSKLFSQSHASIREEIQSIPTYTYSDPNPIPILTTNPKIYPYHKFEGYSHTSKPQDWKVVILENDYIEVYVLPEVGGKVYGAIEKSTGEEFIYKNEVMKFRNIAMRGPWTSGGIEFNFGIIGHHPATASPVDYKLVENEDGSVSCWVGNMDLPSRTYWRVEILLPKDKAYFETRTLWYNPTPVSHSYYNWMTGAAAAREDLEFFCPGDTYLRHSGEPKTWPIDEEGRNIAKYAENHFGPSKSYHVVGEYNNFFGGYFHDKQFGFGHASAYHEMPGQKLWLWAISRQGAIWEDLLTDTDGQYIEFQAGRLFDQYSPGNHVNPITQVGFEPHKADQWTERWFPVKQIGGISAVAEQAVLHATEHDGEISLAINALAAFEGTIRLRLDGNTVWNTQVRMKPMEVYSNSFDYNFDEYWEVELPEIGLHFDSRKEKRSIDRPFYAQEPQSESSPSFHYFQGVQHLHFREFEKAKLSLEKCLEIDPWYLEARVRLGEIYYRSGMYENALEEANRVLSIDTYHPGGNYIAGLSYSATEDWVNAKESLGWAARSHTYRASAFLEMAQLSLRESNHAEARHFAQKSLMYDSNQLKAHWLLALVARIEENTSLHNFHLQKIQEIDPLCFYLQSEKLAKFPSKKEAAEVLATIHNEFPAETYLEAAIEYAHIGQVNEALYLLSISPESPKNLIWKAYLQHNQEDQGEDWLEHALEAPADFVFPYRRESLKVMEWALKTHPSWETRYWLGLNYWGKGRKLAAELLFAACGQQPDHAPFYATRAELMPEGRLEDLKKAVALAPNDWRYRHLLIQELDRQKMHAEALAEAQKAYHLFHDSYTLGLDLAKSHLQTEEYETTRELLGQLQVLPFEGAYEGRKVYELTYYYSALEELENNKYRKAVFFAEDAKMWPENLGVGRPYQPDERIADFLLAYAYHKRNKEREREIHLNALINSPHNNPGNGEFTDVLAQHALRQLHMDTRSGNQDASSMSGPKSDWIKAFYEGNEAKMAEIEAENKNSQIFDFESLNLFKRLMSLKW